MNHTNVFNKVPFRKNTHTGAVGFLVHLLTDSMWKDIVIGNG